MLAKLICRMLVQTANKTNDKNTVVIDISKHVKLGRITCITMEINKTIQVTNLCPVKFQRYVLCNTIQYTLVMFTNNRYQLPKKQGYHVNYFTPLTIC